MRDSVDLLIVTEFGPLMITNVPQEVAEETEKRVDRPELKFMVCGLAKLSNITVFKKTEEEYKKEKT